MKLVALAVAVLALAGCGGSGYSESFKQQWLGAAEDSQTHLDCWVEYAQDHGWSESEFASHVRWGEASDMIEACLEVW